VEGAVLVGWAGLGLAVIMHVMFVSITLGAGLLAAYLRSLSLRDPEWEVPARRVFRILILTELFSGVWGTIITVFLAGFFPAIVALATNILFTPIAIAIAAIMIRIPAIAAAWYTWGRISPRMHAALMWVMAISGFFIPFGFRAIFAEITAPKAVALYLDGITPSPLAAWINLVFWTLYLHTVLAVISTGAFVAASLASLDRDERVFGIASKWGFYALLLQLAAGPIYYFTLSRYSPLLFSNINGPLLPILLLKIVGVIALLYIGFKAYKGDMALGRWAGPLALLIVALGEFLNDGGRGEYLVLIGDKGIPATSFANFYMPIPLGAAFIIVGFFIIALAIFGIAVYYAIYKRFLSEIPEQ